MSLRAVVFVVDLISFSFLLFVLVLVVVVVVVVVASVSSKVRGDRASLRRPLSLPLPAPSKPQSSYCSLLASSSSSSICCFFDFGDDSDEVVPDLSRCPLLELQPTRDE